METNLRANLTSIENAAPERSVIAPVRSIADRLGIGLSSLCVIHCLLTPLAILLLPSLQLAEIHDVFHDTLLVILPLIALVAFIPGYRRHRNTRIFLWSIPGLALIAIGAIGFHGHTLGTIAFSIAGSILLIRAHILNRALCACGRVGSHSHGSSHHSH